MTTNDRVQRIASDLSAPIGQSVGMRNSLVLFATFAVIASCGGSDGESSTNTEVPTSAAAAITDPPATDPPATQPPETEPAVTVGASIDNPPAPEIVNVFSDDGELGLSYTSRLGDSEATIRLLDPAEWPTEVAGGNNVDGVKIFELEPDGAVFAEPVTVTRRLDIAAFDALELGPFDVPLVTMLTQNDAGEYSVLDDLTIVRVGPDLYVSGSTTHFSPIIVSNENRIIPWGPGEGNLPQAPPLSETNVDPDEYLEMVRGLMALPPDQVIVEQSRYLNAQELYDSVHHLIAEQEAADSADGDRGTDAFGGYELLDDDGAMIEGNPLDPLPTSPSDGAYRAQRFGTSFPTIPVSLLPSTSALTGDPNATIAIAVWMPALVLTMEGLIGTAAPDTTADPQPDARPVPTVVIGQDDDGNDIVVEFEIAESCATTFHQPLDENSLSFIRWVFDAPGLAPGTAVKIVGTDGFSQFTTVLADQRIVIEQGISSYGDYPFPAVEWEVDDRTSTSLTLDGSHTVDDREGQPSLTCVNGAA